MTISSEKKCKAYSDKNTESNKFGLIYSLKII